MNASDPVSHRNGYEPRRVLTTAGPVELERPRVRDAQKLGFESRILGRRVARTYALESLVICSFLRGLSVRDVEAGGWSGRREAPGVARRGRLSLVSSRPPSNRACGSPAHGSPTFFTAGIQRPVRHRRLGRGAAMVPLRLTSP